jgi:hypothetical protein
MKICTVYLFDEIWLIVFDFLRLKEVFQCMQISRRWHELSSPRLKYDTSLLKQWHENDMLLSQHESSVKRSIESVSSISLFLGDLGLLVTCFNYFDKISFSVHSLNNIVVFHTTRYNFLSDYHFIFHYHESDKTLIIHFKYKRSFCVHFDYQFNFGEFLKFSGLKPIRPWIIESLELNGRCERCAHFTKTSTYLLSPSPKYYESPKGLIFINRPDLLKVGCQFSPNRLSIFENGKPVRFLSACTNKIKMIDSEHVFTRDKVYNIITGVSNDVVGFDEDAEFYQVGPYLLYESSDHIWKIVHKCGDQWYLSDTLPFTGCFPAFCPRENRLLFFIQ